MKYLPFLACAALLSLTACNQSSDKNIESNAADSTQYQPDNTAIPGDQSNTASDRTITQKIRQSLIADDSLSVNAKNIKVITINGQVTLRGPVNSVSEKNSIVAKAKGVSGVQNVNDELEVSNK